MSLKKIEQVKKDKGFKWPDIIIYAAVLALVVVLFIVIFTTRNDNPLTGVRIYVNAEVVFEYRFGENPTYSANVEVEEDEAGLTVTISDGDGLNVVYIDKVKKSAKMISANCSGRQCMYFPDMNDNSKFIYCNPHRLRVEPYFRDLDSPDILI